MTTGLQLRSVSKEYTLRRGRVARRVGPRILRAVDHVDLTVSAGETVALVGQSGSGKSTLGRLIALLERPSNGELRYNDEDFSTAKHGRLRYFRQRLQIIFQDPYESLDPRFTIEESVGEPLRALTSISAYDRREAVLAAIESVELSPARAFAPRYPYELSGGQRQRVAIARAIVVEPDFLVADEPVSMLDVSIRAGILELLRRLQAERNLGNLFITHDLAVARHMAHRIAVMYQGRVVEIGPAAQIIGNPAHPYTERLLDSVIEIRRSSDSGPNMPGSDGQGLRSVTEEAPAGEHWSEVGYGHFVDTRVVDL